MGRIVNDFSPNLFFLVLLVSRFHCVIPIKGAISFKFPNFNQNRLNRFIDKEQISRLLLSKRRFCLNHFFCISNVFLYVLPFQFVPTCKFVDIPSNVKKI